jgi:hypothetical protein
MEMIEISLRENAKIGVTEHGINPVLFIGSLAATAMASSGNGKEGKKVTGNS